MTQDRYIQMMEQYIQMLDGFLKWSRKQIVKYMNPGDDTMEVIETGHNKIIHLIETLLYKAAGIKK